MPDTRDMTYAECRIVLDDTGVGKIGVSTPVGPRIVAVNYAVVGDAIVFRTSPYSTLGTYARNTTLAFEVGGTADDEHLASSVVAVGRAHIVDDADEMQRLTQSRNTVTAAVSRKTTASGRPFCVSTRPPST